MSFTLNPTESADDYRALLEREYLNRRARNRAYSIRSFARQLKVSKTALHEVMTKNRHLSPKNAEKVATALNWSPLVTEAARRSYGPKAKSAAAADLYLRDDTFHLIADWYHYAILNLIKLPEHRATSAWIARRLGITPPEAKQAIARLLRLGFLEKQGKQFIRKVGRLDTRCDFSSQAVRRFHTQMLGRAEISLENDGIEEREFTSLTVAISAPSLVRAKKLIREFRDRMASVLRDECPDRVYQFTVQLFPLAKARVTP